MTDLKTANMMLARAIACLESAEHDTDVNEAEAIRNRLLDLDAVIGARIQAKIDAHRMIVESWGKVEPDSVKAIIETNDWIGKPEEIPAVSAEEWVKHHNTFHNTEYAQSGDEITEAVLEVSVAEIPQSEQIDGQ